MAPLLWWIILFCLIILISALSLYFLYSVFSDNSKGKGAIPISATSPNTSRLNKYRFRKTDVEDLTSIEAKHQEPNRKISLIDLVESGDYLPTVTLTPTAGRRGSFSTNRKQKRPSLLTDIHESVDDFGSNYSIENILTEMELERNDRRGSGSVDSCSTRKFSVVTEGMRRSSAALLPRKFSLMPEPGKDQESTENLEGLDSIQLETMRKINEIEDQACKIEYEIGYFIGQTRNLKFFEINDKLIRLSLLLTSLDCEGDALKKKKREVRRYINTCKEKLNAKVDL